MICLSLWILFIGWFSRQQYAHSLLYFFGAGLRYVAITYFKAINVTLPQKPSNGYWNHQNRENQASQISERITGRYSCRVRPIIKLIFFKIGSSKFGWLLYLDQQRDRSPYKYELPMRLSVGEHKRAIATEKTVTRGSHRSTVRQYILGQSVQNQIRCR